MTLVESVSIWNQVAAFAIGACLGSFYNMLIYRVPRGLSIVSPGSRCPSCGSSISFYDNVPVLSYLVLGAKCRTCQTSISVRYPLIEAASGLFALLLFRRYGVHAQFVIEFIFLSLLLVIAVIDYDTGLIPDLFSLTGIMLGFVFSFFTPRLSWMGSLFGILLGGGMLYLIAAGYALLRKKEGMGGGDIKLLGMVGAFVGWPGVVFTVLLASMSGMIIALLMICRGTKDMGSAIPFGPFLGFGAAIYTFYGHSIYNWYFTKLLGI